jgi:hypothetical protein
MHAQQSFLNVGNKAILGYHGDQIILNKNVKNIKYVKNHRLFNYQIWQDHRLRVMFKSKAVKKEHLSGAPIKNRLLTHQR